MSKTYEILFSGVLGAYQGQVVPDTHFAVHGGADKYVKMGAIKEVTAPSETPKEESPAPSLPVAPVTKPK